MRARTSEGPPAGKGTTILIDREENASGLSWADRQRLTNYQHGLFEQFKVISDVLL